MGRVAVLRFSTHALDDAVVVLTRCAVSSESPPMVDGFCSGQ